MPVHEERAANEGPYRWSREGDEERLKEQAHGVDKLDLDIPDRQK